MSEQQIRQASAASTADPGVRAGQAPLPAAPQRDRPLLGKCAHLSLPCRDLEEAKYFFTAVLGGELILDVGDFAEVLIGGATIGMSALGGQLPSPTAEYPHCAFYVDADQLLVMQQRLSDLGIPTHEFWTRSGKEALMFFKDPSGNLFELYCQSFPGAERLRRAGTRGHGAIVDLSTLNYDTWKGWPRGD